MILGLIILVSFISGCIAENTMNTYKKNGYSFNCTSSWKEYFDNDNYGKIIVVGEKLNSPSRIDKTGYPVVRVVIIKLNNETPPNGFDNACVTLFNQINQMGLKNISNRTINVGGKQAYEINGFSSNQLSNGTNITTKERIILINNNPGVYMIHCIAPEDEFEKNTVNFDIIINSLYII